MAIDLFSPVNGTPVRGRRAGPSVAIVGAGPGGLAAAMLLAQAGARVTVLEKDAAIGGRSSRITLETERGEFHFDRGPTFFLMPYVLDEIFAATGRRLSDYVSLTRLDPMYRLVMSPQGAGGGGGAAGEAGTGPTIVETTQDLAEMSRRLGRLDPRDGENFSRFISDNRRKLEVFTPILRSAFRSVLDVMNPRFARALPVLHPTQSVHANLGRYFRHPLSKLAMSFQSKYLGMSPFECPSLFTILPFIEYEYGVWHVRGGLNQLMHAMATAVTEMGGVIRTGASVEAVNFNGRRATGVRVQGQDMAFDHVVINADAPWAIKNLIPAAVRPGSLSDRAMDGKRYSCSTYMLYLALREPVELPHHTIYISGRYEANLREIGSGALSEDASLYVCNPVTTDPTMAPKGCSALYVLIPTPNLKASARRIDWVAQGAAMRRVAMDGISKLVGRRVDADVIAERACSPEDWAAGNIQFGATFNLAHNLGQMLHLRPQHRLQGMDGVWLVGGGTHPGSGLPVIFLSSQITASMLAAEAGLADPLATMPELAPARQAAGRFAGESVPAGS